MDDVNIHIDELVLDGTTPLSPEQLQAVLSQEAPTVPDRHLAPIATAVADSLQSRLGGQSRQKAARTE